MIALLQKRGLGRHLAIFGLVLTAAVVLLGVAAPWIAPYAPEHQHAGYELYAPSGYFWVGTDEFGRDLWTRILFGVRLSVLVGVLSTGLSLVAGVLLGLTAGYFRGWAEVVITRCADTLIVFPPLLLGIAIAAVLGPGLWNVTLAAAIRSLPAFIRITRASVLRESVSEYVVAAGALGAVDSRIMFRHILPNSFSAIITQATVSLTQAIHLETALSFLGLGVKPPESSLGTLLSSSASFLKEAPWYGIFPGVLLALLLIGLNYVTDAVRDGLDPLQRR